MRRIAFVMGVAVVVVAAGGACGGADDVPVESHPIGPGDAGGGGGSPDATIDAPDGAETGGGGDAGADASADGDDDTSSDASVDSSADTSVDGFDGAIEASDGSGADDVDEAGDGGDTSDASVEDAASDGGPPSCDGGGSPDAVVTQTGQGVLLRGTVVTPDQVLAGEVLVQGDTITCVAASCAGQPGAATAAIVETHGIIFPGLIDTHNHILFDIFDETDWSPTKAYGNHDQWTNEPRYGAMVDTKQYLNGEGPSPVDYHCELDKYGELKGLVAGTTSIVGAANPSNSACYGTLARTIDQSPNGLGADRVQVATLFPTASSADGVCTNFASSKTDAYLIHIAEGVDATALKEFAALGTVTTTDGCLYAPQTTIVHGTALGDPEMTIMAQSGMSLVWSPRSNVFLYGAGTDFTKTTDIPLALSKGLNVALAPDWSMGGSQNLLDELRFANLVDDSAWGNKLSSKALVSMVTKNAAKALHLENTIGSLAPGLKADIMVIGGDAANPYDALLAATPTDVRLVMVGGTPLYGDLALESLAPATPGCEHVGVCCKQKFLCVATTGGTAANKFAQTYADISSTLSQALVDYDALNLTQWKFAPLTPLVRCP